MKKAAILALALGTVLMLGGCGADKEDTRDIGMTSDKASENNVVSKSSMSDLVKTELESKYGGTFEVGSANQGAGLLGGYENKVTFRAPDEISGSYRDALVRDGKVYESYYGAYKESDVNYYYENKLYDLMDGCSAHLSLNGFFGPSVTSSTSIESFVTGDVASNTYEGAKVDGIVYIKEGWSSTEAKDKEKEIGEYLKNLTPDISYNIIFIDLSPDDFYTASVDSTFSLQGKELNRFSIVVWA